MAPQAIYCMYDSQYARIPGRQCSYISLDYIASSTVRRVEAGRSTCKVACWI